MYDLIIKTVVRALLSVVIGGLIGSERARHGRAAGMRTHVLVCLGSCMTSMTSLFVAETLSINGDVFRIPAQVISGIGFLGAGMIILKSNNVITGLTTAAGVWATGTIGIAIGYGYYIGSITVTLFFLGTIVFFSKFEKKQKSTQVIYIEIDDLYKVNEIIEELGDIIPDEFTYHIFPPKSSKNGNIGISIILNNDYNIDIHTFRNIKNVVYAVKEQ